MTYTTHMDWRYLLFVGLTLIITAVFGYGTFMTARLLKHWQPKENILLLPAENGVRAAVLAICFLLGRGSGVPQETLGWTMPNPLWQLFVGTLIGLLMAALFTGIGTAAIRYTKNTFYTPIIQLVIPRNRNEARLLPFALLLSVLFEEMLFRSLLVGGLSPYFPPVGLVVLFGIIFGLLHSPQGVWGMVGAGLAGVGFGLLFLWQQSLLAPVVAHFVANGAQIWLAASGRLKLPQGRPRDLDQPLE